MTVTATAVPERPLLKPWFRRCPLPDGLLLEHGRATVRFRGAAATRLLPLLVPLLDGRRTVPELVEAVGAAVEPATHHALGLLARHGLLVDGPPVDPATSALDRTAVSLAQHASEPPAAVRARLASARVLLEGDRELVGPLGRLLCRAGLARAIVHEPEGAFVVTAAAAGDPRLEARNDWALDRNAPWLPVGLFDGAAALVGPLVLPGESACLRCLTLRRDAAAAGARELAAIRGVPSAAPLPPGVAALAVAVALDRVVRWLGLLDPLLPGVALAVEAAPELRLTPHPVLRVPRCTGCSPSARRSRPVPWHEAAA